MKNVKHTIMKSASLSALLIGAMATTQCYAQAAGGSDTKTAPGLETVIVTALRDKTDASKTPIALTAISGDALTDQGVTAVSALGEYVPSLAIDQSVTIMRITIRGVVTQNTGETGDPSAAFMLDNIYFSRPETQNISFYDVARVEVLRGPQGTLYGRNTTAGVMNVITNEPNDTQSGSMDLTMGNYNTRVLEGHYNVPVTDWLDMRAAFSYNHHDSYLINSQNNDINPGDDRDDFSARLSAKIKFSDKATLILRGDDSQVHSIAGSYVPSTIFYSNGISGWLNPSSDAARTVSLAPYYGSPGSLIENPRTRRSAWGVNADFNWDMGPVTMTYEGSHRYFRQDDLYNFAGNFGAGVLWGYQSWERGGTNEDSHELRFSLNDAGPLKAQAGIYYFKEGLNKYSSALFGGAYGNTIEPLVKSVSKGVFGQATYAIMPSLRLTAGLRYSEDHKARDTLGTNGLSQTYSPLTDLPNKLSIADYHSSKMTWRAGLEYDIADNAMWYGSISTGYKAGGFNDGCLAGTTGFGLTCGVGPVVSSAKTASQLFYKPENLTSYETGVKTKFFDNRVQIDANVFYYDYKNMQLAGAVRDPATNTYSISTSNASASVYGFELEGQALLSDVDHITYSASLLDAQYGYFQPAVGVFWTNLPLDNSAKWAFSLGYDRTFRVANGDLVFSLFSHWTGKYDISVPSVPERSTLPSYHKSDATLRYQPDHAQWNISLYAKNLEDKVVPVWVGYGVALPSDPRTYGVRFGVNF